MDILRMSLSASLIILAIILMRKCFLYKVSKNVFLVLWGIAVCRLIIPYSISSPFSIYNLFTTQSAETAQQTARIYTITDPNTLDDWLYSDAANAVSNTALSPQMIIWLVGSLACLSFFSIIYLKWIFEFKASLPLKNSYPERWLQKNRILRNVRIRQSDRIKSPLTYGVFCPVIVFPKTTNWGDEETLNITMMHEFCHIRRFDAVAKLVLVAVVCLHWFNPFVWIMYFLASRDIELSCDEAVLHRLGKNNKSNYAKALIKLEEQKRHLSPHTMSFSKKPVEERIASIMKMKKTAIGSILGVALVVAITIGFATSAYSADSPNNINSEKQIIEQPGRSFTVSIEDEHTKFDIDMSAGGLFIVGRESWKAGDTITFYISSKQASQVWLGILPAENMANGYAYDDYGAFNKQTVNVNSNVQEITFVIPADGEYGIGVQHITAEDNASESTPRAAESDISAGTAVMPVTVNISDKYHLELEIDVLFYNPLIPN